MTRRATDIPADVQLTEVKESIDNLKKLQTLCWKLGDYTLADRASSLMRNLGKVENLLS